MFSNDAGLPCFLAGGAARLTRALVYGMFFAALSLIPTGCAKKERPFSKLEKSLQKPVREILRESGVDLYPQSEFLKDSFQSREYQRRGTRKQEKVEYLSEVNVWLASSDSVEKIRDFYIRKYSHTFSGEVPDGKGPALYLASVENIESAVLSDVSPIIVVDIRRNALSEAEEAALKNELALFKKHSAKDLATKKRIKQIKRILARKPLIKINVRIISPKLFRAS